MSFNRTSYGDGLHPPPTPSKSAASLHQLLQELETQFHLGLTLGPTSPQRLLKDAGLVGRIQLRINRLYWKNKSELDRILMNFRQQVRNKTLNQDQLSELLFQLLGSETPTPLARSAPAGNERSSQPLKYLRSSLSGSLFSSADLRDDPNPESVYVTASQTRPGTPTDVEDSDYETPSSPSPSSRAAYRRSQASAESHQKKKRPSDGSAGSVSPKFSKTSNGKQPALPNPIFTKPSLPMARSFQSAQSATTSFSTVFSHNAGDQPYTANTSFATEYTDGEVKYPQLQTSASSPTIGSLDDQDLLEASNSFTFEETAKAPADLNTPSKGSYAIRLLPDHGLFVEDIPIGMRSAPFIIRLQCTRIAAANRISPKEVMDRYSASDIHPSSPTPSYDAFWDSIKSNPKCVDTNVRDSSEAWSAASTQFKGYTLKAALSFNSSSTGPLFNLRVEPLQLENSCRLQRKFGSDRFLYLMVPEFAPSTVPSRFRSEIPHLQRQWTEWLKKDHKFLGRTWRAFHLERVKKKKNERKKTGGSFKRIVLFATTGCDIRPWKIGEMLNWFIPLAKNSDQTFCKAFARLDLGLSRTTATIAFKPSQVRFVDDIVADGTPEETMYNDPLLDWSENCPPEAVMNDGCSLISAGAARLIWDALGSPSAHIPTVFQARIGGAKGLWMVSAAPRIEFENPDHSDIWIDITTSQLKFKPHDDDRDDDTYDPLRLTFEVNSWSNPPIQSDLHPALIEIMVDRGVSCDTIAALMKKRLELERVELLGILDQPNSLRSWVHSRGSKKEERFRDRSPFLLGGLPQPQPEKVIMLLESGFSLETSGALCTFFNRFVENYYAWQEEGLDVVLGRSTYLLGVADPYGVLEPGEIHVQFSQALEDRVTGESWRGLTDIELLVARHPACRRSDIQKVRATFKHQLAHLVDIVVFPSKGQFPLAGKLQGGDYDGDHFWLCWEPSLVQPFKNAPAPLHSPDPREYFIQVDKRQLRKVMNVRNLDTIGSWLTESFKFRDSPELLGNVTNFLESYVYQQGHLFSAETDLLCGLHDLLVDSAKQGFIFTHTDFNKFCLSHPIMRRNGKKQLPKPAYKVAMENAARGKNEIQRVPKEKVDSVLDHLFFRVLRRHNAETLKKLKTALNLNAEDKGEDPVLQKLYNTKKDSTDPVLRKELERLVYRFESVYEQWVSFSYKGDPEGDSFREIVLAAHEKYKSIMPSPSVMEHPIVQEWLDTDYGNNINRWDLIRASALARRYGMKGSFIFHMAGEELVLMKIIDQPHARHIHWPLYTNLKPRKPKWIWGFDGADEDIDDDGYDTAVEYLS